MNVTETVTEVHQSRQAVVLSIENQKNQISERLMRSFSNVIAFQKWPQRVLVPTWSEVSGQEMIWFGTRQ